MNLKEKVAVVTGASSGIGQEFAVQLHKLGMDIVAVARRAERLQELADNLNQERAESCKVIVADLEDPDQGLNKVIEYISNHRVDLLVNNAGRGSFGHFEELPLEIERGQIALNVEATLQLAHAVIPQLKQRKSGGIISISSLAAFQPLPYMATYAATKVFNLWHSLGLWAELRGDNIAVTAVCPGPVATEFGGVARVPGEVTGVKRDSTEAVVSESIAAFLKKRPIVVPGNRSKLLSIFFKLTPLALRSKITARLLRGSLPAQNLQD